MVGPGPEYRDLLPAPHRRRLAALLVDVALVWLATSLITGALGAIPDTSCPEGGCPSAFTDALFAGLTSARDTLSSATGQRPEIVFIGLALGLFGLYAIPWWSIGTSPGKWLLGLRLTTVGGSRPGPLRAIARFVAWVVLLPIAWVWTLARADRAGLHDLLARTRLTRVPEAGLRRIARGTIRRGVTDLRWAAAGLAVVLLGGGVVAAGLRFREGLAPTPSAPMAAEVDQVTQEAIKGAILEYNRMEEHAGFRLDATILRPRATRDWTLKRNEEFEELRRSGRRQDSRLLEARFQGFRWAAPDRIEADVVEVWASAIFDRQGRVVQETPRHEVPQTAILVREGGQWKLADVRFYGPGEVPF